MTRHTIESEVTGNVYTVEVAVGQVVAEGDTLFLLESMKMQIPVEASRGGTIRELLVQSGEMVSESQPVAVIES